MKILLLISISVFIFSCNRSTPKELVVLTNLVPAQQRYLQNEVLSKFEKLYKCKVRLVNYDDDDELEAILNDENKSSEITLASIPLELTQSLAAANKITPMTDIVASHVLLFDVASYHYKFSDIGRIKGIYYYLPHRIEVPVLFYLKSKARDAIKKFDDYEVEINSVLKTMNGFGLPKNYVLEENSNEWDLYDIFVLGYIWKKENNPKDENGYVLAREMNNYSNLNMLCYNALALGATWDNIVNMSGDEVEEVFLWEMVMGNHKIFNSLSYGKNVSNADVYKAFGNGDAFMAYFSQKDCFNILEGTDESSMIPYIFDASDVGITLVPMIVPFSLNKSGKLLSAPQRISAMRGYYWGIPKNAEDKELAYLLMQYLNNRVINTKESVRFGAIPVREDVLMNMQNIYDERWLGEGYTAALGQIMRSIDDKDWLSNIRANDLTVCSGYVYLRGIIGDSAQSYKNSDINKYKIRSFAEQYFEQKDKN